MAGKGSQVLKETVRLVLADIADVTALFPEPARAKTAELLVERLLKEAPGPLDGYLFEISRES